MNSHYKKLPQYTLKYPSLISWEINCLFHNYTFNIFFNMIPLFITTLLIFFLILSLYFLTKSNILVTENWDKILLEG